MQFTREDKLKWGNGPWVDEIDQLSFTYKGIKCWIDRKSSGSLCGYIVIPDTHKYAKDIYENTALMEALNVHGGITWGEKTFPNTCYGAPTVEKNEFVLGFDCAHGYQDYVPRYAYSERELAKLNSYFEKGINDHKPENYKTIEFVKNELCKLVDQVLDK